jgi:DNA repair exonuclease SbcCD ATPase subunit
MLDELPGKIAVFRSLLEMKPKLETAKKIIESTNKDISEKEADGKEADTSFAEKQRTIQGKINKLQQDIALKMPKISSTDLTTLLNASKDKITITQRTMGRSITIKIDLEKDIAILEDKAKMSEDDTKKIAELKTKEQLIRKELKKWDYIRAGLSKSGLQALEISSAAPLLTGIANDLLHEAYGGEFYLELRTRDPETGAEILEIWITREDGESFPLANYSGGESVWVLQSFKAAQILVNTEKSGISCLTCYCDEETGALDTEMAEKFVLMYRALRKKGNFEKLIFISHLKNCQAMADHALEFKKGGIEIS